jgi:hypothetical protein
MSVIMPFVVVFFWSGLWELLYTENTLVNILYMSLGYVGVVVCEYNGEEDVHQVFMVFFWCGASKLLYLPPIVSIVASLSVFVLIKLFTQNKPWSPS